MLSRSVIPCLTAFIGGVAPWLITNAVFVQVASLVRLAGPSIPAIVAVFVQVGTLAAVIYATWPLRWVPEWMLITFTFGLNLAAGLALSLAWDKEVTLAHHPWLLTVTLATAAAGVSGALAVVQLYPIAARGGRACTVAFSSGMGANGVLASLLGLALPNPTLNYIVVTVIVLVSLLAALVLLTMLPVPDLPPPPKDEALAVETVALVQQDDQDIYQISARRWRTGWPEAALQLALACLNYSLISLVPYALPTLLRVASIGAPALGSASRFLVGLLPLPARKHLTLPAVVLCLLWLGLFFAAISPPSTGALRYLTLAGLFLFNILYGMMDTVVFLFAGQLGAQHREKAVRIVGAGQQTGAGIGSLFGLLFAILWSASY